MNWPTKYLRQGLKHAVCGTHVAREGILCGPRWFLGSFKWSRFTLFSSFTGVQKYSASERTSSFQTNVETYRNDLPERMTPFAANEV